MLEEWLWKVNDNTKVKLFSSETYDEIARYDGKDSIPDSYSYCEITDIFVEDGWLCVEIDTEDAEEEEEEKEEEI